MFEMMTILVTLLNDNHFSIFIKWMIKILVSLKIILDNVINIWYNINIIKNKGD